ncbi:hypothetical protein [Nostoc sp. FACHB-892]|uniref:hypothetical protein n=1 Tax=Nostoc sp. FACHB-892 TaxID=2692843 RepID=UPI001A7EC0FC|nr:hypothetical protein [Nostoc sp. FACHB-892]
MKLDFCSLLNDKILFVKLYRILKIQVLRSLMLLTYLFLGFKNLWRITRLVYLVQHDGNKQIIEKP